MKVLSILEKHIRKTHITNTAAAEHWGVYPSMVSDVLNGKKSIPKYMLDDIGWERIPQVIRYRKKLK